MAKKDNKNKNVKERGKETKNDTTNKRPRKTVIALVSVSVVAIGIGALVTVMALAGGGEKNVITNIFDQNNKQDSTNKQQSEESYLTSPKGWTEETRWKRSGPIAVNKPVYKIGENVFFTVSGLRSHDNGNLTFYRPDGKSYFVVPFDGAKRQEFKQYFKPSLSRPLNTTHVDDLIGTWTVKLEGTQYPPLQFEIIDEYLAGEKRNYKSIEKKPIGPVPPNETATIQNNNTK